MTLTSAIPVLRTGDYRASRSFWQDIMGFEIIEEGGDPPRFGIFRRDEQTVFVDAWHGPEPAPYGGWRAYFHCPGVDTLAATLIARGAILSGPVDTVYGMREVVVTDPAGNRLCFGQEAA